MLRTPIVAIRNHLTIDRHVTTDAYIIIVLNISMRNHKAIISYMCTSRAEIYRHDLKQINATESNLP